MLSKIVGRLARDAASSHLGASARAWLGFRSPAKLNHEIFRISIPGEVVVYFGDVAGKGYQLEQWLPVFEYLNEHHRVLLVFRKVGALRELKRKTSLRMISVRRFEDLMELYEENDYRLCIYVNNGVNNFQSLANPRMVHVHVNHGESDKLSMVSNQIKAYDRVFIAGPAALDRHRAVLLDFDESQLTMVGRPQLDIDFAPELTDSPMHTVMYAPTWEGENEANNYTSVDIYGTQIVQGLLNLPNTRVVYKPHPRITSSKNSDVAARHTEILEMIMRQNEADGTAHVVSESGNILAMFTEVDALVTDVSSVGLDFLYLHPEKPLVLTDRRSDRTAVHRDSPVSKACPIIDGQSEAHVSTELREAFENDRYASSRGEMRRYYFGDLARGDATERFISTVSELLEERGHQLMSYYFHGGAMEAADE